MKKILSWICIYLITFFSFPIHVYAELDRLALPQGGNVVSGQVDINYAALDQLNVNQSTNQAIVNWQSFNVGRDASVHFNQPGSKASILNNVLSGQSIINGKIFSNGRLFLVNPTGILTGPHSAIKAEGAILSTLNLTNQNFLNNNYQFNTNSNSSLVNQGLIEGQYVALISPQVNNKGNIITSAATTIVAGDDVLLGISNSNNLTVKVAPSKLKAMAKNEGTIKTQNGIVTIKADAAQSLVDEVVKLPNARADGLVSENGVIKLISNSGSIQANKIKIDTGSKGATEISGTLNSDNKEGKGGTIEITGKDIDVNSATISADGKTGGGKVLIGGDWQGTGDLLQATYLDIDSNSKITANALTSGSGGTIVAWSDIKNSNSFTRVSGTLEAKGIDGSGGQIETSGADLNINGIKISTSSVTGSYGNWLVDPTNLTIDSSAAATYATNLETSDVTITADKTITLSSNLAYTGARNSTLTFNATTTVLSAAISSSSGSLNIDINSAVTVGTDVTVTTNGGYFDVSGNISAQSDSGIIEFRYGGTYLYNGSSATANSSGTAVGNGSISLSGSTYTWTKPNSLSSTKLLVVGGGGGGGFDGAGGGGAGGLIYNASYSLSNDSYSITVGAGGARSTTVNGQASNGGNSTFADQTAIGGGGGGSKQAHGRSGGSGGGYGHNRSSPSPGSGTSGQGNSGGSSGYNGYGGSGGGGAGGAGSGPSGTNGGAGGAGLQYDISGSDNWYAAGGGGGTWAGSGGAGGSGIGGAGGSNSGQQNGGNGTAHTGSGGGSNGWAGGSSAGNGGSGVVIINYSGTSGSLNLNTGSGQVNLQGNVSELTSLTINSNSSSEVAGVISGSGTIVKQGTGTLTLSGNNTYTGGTTVSAGTLFGGAASRSNSVFGTGSISVASGTMLWVDRSDDGALTNALTLNGGTLRGTNGFGQYWDGNITLGAHSTIKADNNFIIDGVISGSSKNLTKTGNGNLLLRGNNTYTGSTTISAGTLTLSGSGNLGNGSYAGAIANSGVFKFDTSANLISTGVISGSGVVNVSGTGIFEPTATNTYTGGTVIDGGVIAAKTDRNFGAEPSSDDPDNILLKNTGTIYFGSVNSSNTLGHVNFGYNNNRGIYLETGQHNFIDGSGGSGRNKIYSVISGVGGVTYGKVGNKTMTIYSANTYTGDTKFNYTTGSNNGVHIANADAWKYSTVYLNSTRTDVRRGWTVVSGGSINFGGLAGDATNWRWQNKQVTFGYNNQDTTFSGTISQYNNDGYDLVKVGTGTTTFSNTSSNAHQDDVNGIDVQAGKVILSGNWGRNNDSNGDFNIESGATLEIDSSINNSFDGVLSGAGTLLLGGSGTQTFSGNNTFSGIINIADGGFKAENNNALGSVTSVTSSGGRISTASSITLPSLIVSGNVQLDSGITTTGAQTYTSDVLVASGTTESPVEFNTTNSNIVFGGTLKGQGNSKARSITIDAGTGNIEFGDRVGYAFNDESFDPDNTADSFYKMTMTANDITIKGDVMTYEEQVYNGNVVVSSTGSNGTTRTLLSIDPKVTINGTVNDSTSNTHSLIAKAVAIRRDGIVAATPEIAFNGKIGTVKALAGYSGVTGYQVVSKNYGIIDSSTSFGTVTGGSQTQVVTTQNNNSRSSQSNGRRTEKSANSVARSAQTTIADAGRNLIATLFGGGPSGGGRTFSKSIEVVIPGDAGFNQPGPETRSDFDKPGNNQSVPSFEPRSNNSIGSAPAPKSQGGKFDSTNQGTSSPKPRSIKELFSSKKFKDGNQDPRKLLDRSKDRPDERGKGQDDNNKPDISEDDEEEKRSGDKAKTN
jgi:fibronectin-binding autotransporter adhesin